MRLTANTADVSVDALQYSFTPLPHYTQSKLDFLHAFDMNIGSSNGSIRPLKNVDTERPISITHTSACSMTIRIIKFNKVENTHTNEKKTSSSWVERERLPVVLCINNKTHTSHGFDPLNLIAGCMTLNGVLSA